MLEYLLKDEIASGKVEIRDIPGLTIEHRVECMQAVPDDVMDELKNATSYSRDHDHTQKGRSLANIESANVAMRKELDLFANVRPVKVPEQGIDWVFYRENTEGAYAVGSKGSCC